MNTVLKRRPKRIKARTVGVPSLYIIGCGFAILILISAFAADYDNYRKTAEGYSYADLKKVHTVIGGDYVYEFMNSALFDDDSLHGDSLEFTKLSCFTLEHSPTLRAFITDAHDTLLTAHDRAFMAGQLSTKEYLWDNKKLNNAWCLTPRDHAKLGYAKSGDYWEDFRGLFGNYGYHHFSKPVFNAKRNRCVIEHSGQGGWLIGSGSILLFKKSNGSWLLVEDRMLWMS